jgi:cobalamin biosynthesis protein CbiG
MGTGNKTAVSIQLSAVSNNRKANSPAAIFYITDNGLRLAKKIKRLYHDAHILKFKSAGAYCNAPLQRYWSESGNLIFIMATGIVVRTIAPLLKDKRTDPAVVVLDEKGVNVISLLSGHAGGANRLAREVADFLGAQAVITTASDVQGRTSLDIWAEEKGLYVEDHERLKHLSAKIVNGKKVKVYTGNSIFLQEAPAEFNIVGSPDNAEVIISEELHKRKALYLRPRNLFAGIGCNRGTSRDEIQREFTTLLKEHRLSARSIDSIATINLKIDEKGLLAFAADNNLSVRFFPADALNAVADELGMKGSKRVMAATGAVAVSEPAAVLAAREASERADIIVPKEKRGNATLAIARAEFTL